MMGRPLLFFVSEPDCAYPHGGRGLKKADDSR